MNQDKRRSRAPSIAVIGLIENVCGFCRVWIHAARMRAVVASVLALLRCGSLCMTTIGRALPGNPKHGIKRIDRLLSNTKLHREIPRLYAALAATLLRGVERPVLLLDWSKVTDGFHTLTTSVAFEGRSFPLYSEVHPEEKLGDKKVQKRYLKRLAGILPMGCLPILVFDAGFGHEFFKAVTKHKGWHFVSRLRGNRLLCKEGTSEWLSCKDVRDRATSRAVEQGQWQVCKTRRTDHYRLITYRKKSGKKRSSKSKADSYSIRAYKARAREPWLLATSLSEHRATHIVHLYRQRMQIEENFRDLKNHRFGWSLRHVRSGFASRLNVLLLIAALAMLATLLLGRMAEQRGHHLRYQSNTISNRRVLSFFFLGKLVLQRGDTAWISTHALHEEICLVREVFRRMHPLQGIDN